MRTGPCEIPRIDQLRVSLAGELATLLYLLEQTFTGPNDQSDTERRLVYIKQVFDLCGVPMPYQPGWAGRMQWGDALDVLEAQYGSEHLCPECGYLLDVPTYRFGDMVCLRDGCDYRLRRGGDNGYGYDGDGR